MNRMTKGMQKKSKGEFFKNTINGHKDKDEDDEKLSNVKVTDF